MFDTQQFRQLEALAAPRKKTGGSSLSAFERTIIAAIKRAARQAQRGDKKRTLSKNLISAVQNDPKVEKAYDRLLKRLVKEHDTKKFEDKGKSKSKPKDKTTKQLPRDLAERKKLLREAKKELRQAKKEAGDKKGNVFVRKWGKKVMELEKSIERSEKRKK